MRHKYLVSCSGTQVFLDLYICSSLKKVATGSAVDRMRIGSGFNGSLDPDPDSQSGSRKEKITHKNIKS
jgi:hypothetical protein